MVRWKIKVHQTKERTFLWGGSDINMLYVGDEAELFFRNDDLGEPCKFGVRNTAGIVDAGTLQPGESWLMRLGNSYGIWAKCVDPKVDTVIECTIIARS